MSLGPGDQLTGVITMIGEERPAEMVGN
jgi:hypothetical protein